MSIKTKKEEKNIDNTAVEKAYMYIGPSIPKEGLTSGTMVRGKLDKRMIGILEKYPTVNYLLVPVDKELSNKKNEVKKKGTVEHTMYVKTLEIIGGKK